MGSNVKQSDNKRDSTSLLDAQPNVYRHMNGYSTSAAVRAALQLSIPAVIRDHGKPMSLQDLASEIGIPPSKVCYLRVLMQMLENAGFVNALGPDRGAQLYKLTASSELLIPGQTPCVAPFLDLMHHPAVLYPLGFLADWFRDKGTGTPFAFVHGKTLGSYAESNSEFKNVADRAMDSDSSTLSLFLQKCRSTFEGVNSLVDVGGGRGDLARIVVQEFPGIRCTVLDLPHVVANLRDDGDVKFESGDMFKHIPQADIVMLKLMLHAWNDDECVAILKKCREAVENGNGKVVIIDIVLKKGEDSAEVHEAKLNYGFMGLVLTTGWERNEEEWRTLFLKAGFSTYKISVNNAGIRSLIEVFP